MRKSVAIAWLVSLGMSFYVGINVNCFRSQVPEPLLPEKSRLAESGHADNIEQEITFENKTRKIRLSGTFTRPKRNSSFPTVLLVSAGGPTCHRDTYKRSQMYAKLADELCRHGIATLRYDKRGMGNSEGAFGYTNLLEFADDASWGLNYLKTRSDVRSDAIGVLGHSEGGLAASIVASSSKELAFAILMATPARPTEELNLDWIRLEYKSLGHNEMSIQQIVESERLLHKLIKSGNTDAQTLSRAKAIVGKSNSGGDIDDVVNDYFSPPYRFLLTYDPISHLREIRCPVLVLNGDQDRIVQSQNELPIIEAALTANHNSDVTITRFAELNHAFRKTTKNPLPGADKVDDVIDPVVLQTIEGWISERSKEGTQLKGGKRQEKGSS